MSSGDQIADKKEMRESGWASPCPGISQIDNYCLSRSIDADSAKAMEEHVQACPGCRARIEELRANRQYLNDVQHLLAPAEALDAVRTTNQRERLESEPHPAKVFLQALQLRGNARREFIRRLQDDHPRIAEQVAGLLTGAATVTIEEFYQAEGIEKNREDERSPFPVSTESSIEWDIPDYERMHHCGSGAFGQVWAVRNRIGVFRALKTLSMNEVRNSKMVLREVQALRDYCRNVRRHPNLIEVFHVGVWQHLLYYTMELADDDGTRRPVRDRLPPGYRPLTLDRIMARHPLNLKTSLEIVLQTLRGLSRLHEAGISHRDIKPANIIFVERRPKLADIGLVSADVRATALAGTPAYMPPDLRMDATADTYAMGTLLFQFLARKGPFELPELDDFEPMESSDLWNTSALLDVVGKARSPDAKDRFQSAEEMLECVEACREMNYDNLFADLEEAIQLVAPSKRPVYVPIVVAAIHKLPWIIGLVLLIILAKRFV